MTTPTDKRLIEDYLPIVAISAEASREKVGPQGAHLHTASVVGTTAARRLPGGGLWRARASVAVRAERCQRRQEEIPRPGQRRQVRRAALQISRRPEGDRRGTAAHPRSPRRAADPGDGEAGHRGRTSRPVARPRPKVLDMFAGGGAIPLEALRLGCEAYAST